MTMTGLEQVYRFHHQSRRGEDFVTFGEARGRFFRRHIGTGKRVLDVGCRDGALTAQYAAGNAVLGVDIDSVALARAKEKLGIETLHMDLNGAWDGIPAEQFDAIVAAEVIEHLYYPDAVLEKIAVVLRPGGTLVGSVPHAFSVQNRMRFMLGTKRATPLADPTHINHFWGREFKTLLERRFFVRDITPILSWKFDWIPLRAVRLWFAHSLLFYCIKKGDA